MKILFDQGVPVPLRVHLQSHSVETAYERQWSNLKNGELLKTAEQNGFDLFVTTDQQLRDQQNLSDYTLAIVVILSTSWPRIQLVIDSICSAIDGAAPGAYIEVEV